VSKVERKTKKNKCAGRRGKTIKMAGRSKKKKMLKVGALYGASTPKKPPGDSKAVKAIKLQ